MLRKGYIERLVEELTLVLAKLLGLKNDKDYEGALVEVRAACKRLSGMDIDTLVVLPEETLVALFTAGGALDLGKCVVVATLLGEQAEIHELQGRADAAAVGRRKALVLFVEALLQEESLRTGEHRARADALIAKLRDHERPAALEHRLFRYHEAVGNYARAEDTLFALREGNHPGARAEATAFYRRLLTRPDEELASGGLPREEVEEGLAGLTPPAAA